MSVFSSSSGVRLRIRATSMATLPTPTTATRSCERSNWQIPIVGMAVVPGDELGRGVAARQVLAGDPHAPVGLGTGRVDDLVVVGAQVGDVHVLAELDAAEEAEPRMRGDLVEGRRHRLDLLVIGRDPGPHQADTAWAAGRTGRRPPRGPRGAAGARRRRSPPVRRRRSRPAAAGRPCRDPSSVIPRSMTMVCSVSTSPW